MIKNVNRLLGDARTMEQRAGGSELLGAGIGRLNPGPGCFSLLLSGSGHSEVASSLPTPPLMMCLLCYIPQSSSVGEPCTEHCIPVGHRKSSFLSAAPVLLSHNEKPAQTIICCLGFCNPQFEKQGTGIFCFSLSSLQVRNFLCFRK